MWGRVGALCSSPSSLEGPDTQLTLLQSLSLSASLSAMVELNNSSLIIYLYLPISFTLTHAQLSTSLHTHTHTHASRGWVLRRVLCREQAGICTEGNLIGIPCAKHMRSPPLTDPARQPVSSPPLPSHENLVSLTNQLQDMGDFFTVQPYSIWRRGFFASTCRLA